MWRSELGLLFRRRRTIALLAVLAAVPILAAVAIAVAGGGSGGPAFLSDLTHNGVFAALAGLTLVVAFLLPLSVAIVAGDTIAGEASLGTLRYLLARPTGRTRLLVVKFGTTVVFCIVAALVVAVAGLVVGAILFPLGPVTTLSGFDVSLATGVLRVFEAAGIVGVSMIGLAAIGLFVSTLTEVPVGAMGATVVIFIAVQIADNVPQLHSIHPGLFSNHWMAFADLLRAPISYGSIEADLLLQGCWALVFFLAAWARFTTADVLA
ncbi:MAG: ABC transporter permease [Acidimicrobiales bacterium]